MPLYVHVLNGHWLPQRWAQWSRPQPFSLCLSASFSLSSFCSGERLSLLEDHPSKLPQLVPSQSRAPQQCRRQCGKFEHPLEHLEQSTKQICLQPHPVRAAIVGNSIIMLLARFRLPLFSINLRLNGRFWFALSVCHGIQEYSRHVTSVRFPNDPNATNAKANTRGLALITIARASLASFSVTLGRIRSPSSFPKYKSWAEHDAARHSGTESVSRTHMTGQFKNIKQQISDGQRPSFMILYGIKP